MRGLLLTLAFAGLVLPGCGLLPGTTAAPAATAPPRVVGDLPTAAPATATPVATANVVATATPVSTAPPAAQPTSTPSPTPPPAATATPAPVATPTGTPLAASTVPAGSDRVRIYMVLLGDNGRNGKRIGCDDSIVPIDAEIAPTTGVLRAALDRLLSARQREYGNGRYYNALSTSRLQVDRVELGADGRATVALSGQVSVAGVCDEPRVIAQIEETVGQFATVRSAAITVNGRPLAQLFR